MLPVESHPTFDHLPIDPEGFLSPPFRLYTFGTLRLTGASEETLLRDHGHQRRRVALLAVLAAAGEAGRSRDQLLGLFWPDVPQARARHSLEQLLYVMRTSLESGVFARANPLQLNRGVVGSDVADFADAVERDDLESAVELYRGPFLDGFYLSDTPGFDEWLDSERARLVRCHGDALLRLATRAEAASDRQAAVRWRQMLVDADPLSSANAAGLIRALADAGDHTAALRHAERYTALVRQQFDTDVGPAVAEVVAEVRARASGGMGGGHDPKMETRPRAAPDHADSGVPPLSSGEDAADATRVAISGRRTPRRAVRRWSVIVPLLAVAALAAWLLRPFGVAESAAPPSAFSLVVLPLVNLSDSPGDAVLADGITEELISVLSSIDRLRVIARTSAFAFRDSRLEARRVADTLRVANVLEGSMRKAGQSLRVQVRLIDGRDGSTRWSETYDRQLNDVFEVQSDIARAVARELDVRIGAHSGVPVRKRPTRNIAAYELYRRGSDPTAVRSDSAARLAIRYFEEAIALDSTYAAAHAGLARLHNRFSTGGNASADEHLRTAKQHALRAVSLDDSLAEGHASLAMTFVREYRYAEAEAEFTRALALDPSNTFAREHLTRLYLSLGRPAEALDQARRVVEIDPYSASARAELGRALCVNELYEEGLAQLDSLDAVRPPPLRVNGYKALCHILRADWPAAISILRLTGNARSDGALGYALARDGRRTEAIAIVQRLEAGLGTRNGGAFAVALVHAGLGNVEQTNAWLNRSIDDRSLDPLDLAILLPDFESDSRFAAFRQRLRR